MDNELWMRIVLEVLKEFASEDFQIRVWLKGEGPEVSSFEEAVCKFFDDNVIDLLLDVEWRQVGLTENQRNKLKIFRDALDKFNDSVEESPHPKDILFNPDWPKVRSLAKEAMDAFKGSYWKSSKFIEFRGRNT